MTPKKHRLLYGAHMSIAGGLPLAIERGESIHCTAIQIFTKSNRQWQAKPITQEEATAFCSAAKNSSITSIVAHASYLINLASAEARVREQSTAALVVELERCEQLGIPDLILHPGSFGASTEQEGAAHVSACLDVALEKAQSNTHILLENMAGQGSSVGATFKQLAQIRNNVHAKRKVGFAFDTCHAFAAGYSFSDPASYHALWDEFDAILGLQHLKAVHVNDSKKECGCRVDRHEDIGKGKIGLEAFRLLFNDPRFFDIPKILETPQDELQDYARNMHVLRELISENTEKLLGI